MLINAKYRIIVYGFLNSLVYLYTFIAHLIDNISTFFHHFHSFYAFIIHKLLIGTNII
jgi:hypothetical protein